MNDIGGNLSQEAPELCLQVTSQNTKMEMEKGNLSGILCIGAASKKKIVTVQVSAR